MKNSKLLIGLGLGLAITLVVGMGLALGESVQEQEEAIRQLFLKGDKAWENDDLETFLTCYSEDAQIMVGKEKRIVSKDEYRKMLPSIFEDLGPVQYGPIKITLINELSATVERESTLFIRGREIILYKKLDLIYRKGKWVVQRSTFE